MIRAFMPYRSHPGFRLTPIKDGEFALSDMAVALLKSKVERQKGGSSQYWFRSAAVRQTPHCLAEAINQPACRIPFFGAQLQGRGVQAGRVAKVRIGQAITPENLGIEC